MSPSIYFFPPIIPMVTSHPIVFARDRRRMSKEPNVISLERFPISRGVLLDKKLYDAAQVSRMIAHTGNYRIPHSRRHMTQSELINIMYKAGRRLPIGDEIPHLSYSNFISKRQHSRQKHEKGALQHAHTAAKVAKLQKILVKKLESPALEMRSNAQLPRLLSRLRRMPLEDLLYHLYQESTDHHPPTNVQFRRVRAEDRVILKSIGKMLVERLSHSYTTGNKAWKYLLGKEFDGWDIMDYLLETLSKTSPTMILEILSRIAEHR